MPQATLEPEPHKTVPPSSCLLRGTSQRQFSTIGLTEAEIRAHAIARKERRMNLEPCFQSWDSNQAQFEGHGAQCHNSKLALKEEQAGRWMLLQPK